jgi:hypothetical protein
MRQLGRLILLFCALGIVTARNGFGEDASLERKVKAAFLANFAQFIEWSENNIPAKEGPVIIGVIGDDSFADVVEEAAAHKTVNGMSLKVKKYKTVEEAGESHILFVGSSRRADTEPIVRHCRKTGTLTVGEHGTFLESGGVIRFVIRDERVQLEINPDAAKAAGLKISSKLLRLASIVKPKED